MPTPFVADAADEAVRSESILNERKAADIIEETALEVDIRAWRAVGLRLLQAASAREEHVPNGARRPCSVLGDASAQAAIEDAVTRMSRTEGYWRRVVISHRCYFVSSRAGTLAKCILAKTTRGAIPT